MDRKVLNKAIVPAGGAGNVGSYRHGNSSSPQKQEYKDNYDQQDQYDSIEKPTFRKIAINNYSSSRQLKKNLQGSNLILGFENTSTSPNARAQSISSHEEGSPHPMNLLSTKKQIEITDQLKSSKTLNPLSKIRSQKQIFLEKKLNLPQINSINAYNDVQINIQTSPLSIKNQLENPVPRDMQQASSLKHIDYIKKDTPTNLNSFLNLRYQSRLDKDRTQNMLSYNEIRNSGRSGHFSLGGNQSPQGRNTEQKGPIIQTSSISSILQGSSRSKSTLKGDTGPPGYGQGAHMKSRNNNRNTQQNSSQQKYTLTTLKPLTLQGQIYKPSMGRLQNHTVFKPAGDFLGQYNSTQNLTKFDKTIWKQPFA